MAGFVCLSVRLSLGDWAGSLVLGEVSWPLVYGVAVDLLGSDLVHKYVGVEGYSRYDSPFTLTKTGPGTIAPPFPRLSGSICFFQPSSQICVPDNILCLFYFLKLISHSA